MPDQDRDPVRIDHIGSRRLCIVSHDPLLCGPFVAALQTVLSPHDEFEIIQDRRRDRSPTEAKPDVADQPSIDRRRHPYVDRLLGMDGFAIVPATFLPPAAPIDALFPDDTNAAERERLEGVRSFRRQQALRLVAWFSLAALLGASAVLFLFSPAAQTLMAWVRSEAPPSENPPPTADRINSRSAVVQAAPAIRTTSITENTSPDVPTPARLSLAVSKTSEPAGPPQGLDPPRAVLGPVVSVPRVANVEPPAAASPEVAPAAFVDLPRAELMRDPAPAAEGQGDVYAVRISDAADQPLAGADVVLFARMADDTVENIPLGPGAEPGTYHGTAPPAWSTPVDLRIRVTTSDKRVELPLAR